MNHNNVKIGKEIINESKNNTHLFYVDVIKVLAALIRRYWRFIIYNYIGINSFSY